MVNDISMTPNTFRAIDDACDHTARALSAAQAAEPFDSCAMIALDRIRSQLRDSLQTLQAIKRAARVTP